jgi:hypothetical protein
MYSSLIQNWYQWGHFVGLAIAAGAAFWVFYEAARRRVEPTLWKALTVAAVVLVLPSLVFWAVPALSANRFISAVIPLAYVGMGAAALALVSLALYAAGVGVGPGITYCPDCEQPQHPSWEYCPYCAERQAQQADATMPAQPPPPSPAPPEPTEPAVFPEPEAAPARMQKTEVLRPTSPDTLAWLVLLSGTHAGKEFRLGQTTTIGRDPAHSDVVLDDSAVSRQHAKVRLRQGIFVLHDLASTSGTFVRDRETDEWVEVHKHTLVDGDRIKMGRALMSFMQIAGEEV